MAGGTAFPPLVTKQDIEPRVDKPEEEVSDNKAPKSELAEAA